MDARRTVTRTQWLFLTGLGCGLVGSLAEAAPPIGQRIWLNASMDTTRYVSSALPGLQASASCIQGPQRFEVADAGNGFIALKATATGQYVSVNPTDARLIANASSLQGASRFEWIDVSGNPANLNNSIHLRHNGSYVSADQNVNALVPPLVANRPQAQGWETFTWGTLDVDGLGASTGAWPLRWRDDFNTAPLRTDRWEVKTQTAPDNEEQQKYPCSNANAATCPNLRVGEPDADGVRSLKLIARAGGKTEAHCGTITSAKVQGQSTGDFTHGRIAARLKLPVGEGLWPAFWLLGESCRQGGSTWPGCGEIDIMENIGYANWYSSSLHGPGRARDGVSTNPDYSGRDNDGRTPITGQFCLDSSSNWHTYRVDWTPNEVTWFLDGVQTMRMTRAEVLARYGGWVFDGRFFIILNLAVGGTYPESFNKATLPCKGVPQATMDLLHDNPPAMEVDWVAVYELPATP